MDKVDFNTHEEYDLGDTHLTYDQIARAAGVTSDRVRWCLTRNNSAANACPIMR